MRIGKEIQKVLRRLVKQGLIDQLLNQARKELITLESAAQATHDYATDQDIKAEGKYDTRAIEASYLAQAEAKRVEELKLEIQILEEVELDSSQKYGEISIGALVELKFNDFIKKYFLIPTAGGTVLEQDGDQVIVVSVFSPIGDAMLGLKTGDEFEVETPKFTRTYQIISFH